MRNKGKSWGPYAQPGMPQRVSAMVEAPASITFSGELSVQANNISFRSPRFAGKITDAWLTVQESGRDDTLNDLYVEGNVYINGSTVLTTKPKIVANSGEASEQKTTIVTGDTNITQAVIDGTANSYNPGDALTGSFELTRTSPTTEMADLVLVIEFEPFAN